MHRTAAVPCVHAFTEGKKLIELCVGAWKTQQLCRNLHSYGFAPRRHCAVLAQKASIADALLDSKRQSMAEASAVVMMSPAADHEDT